MLSSLKNIFKVPDLRNKVVFTLGVIGLYQLGANVITPYISISQVQALENQAKSAGILGFLNLFSGGGLLRMAIFGLGIMPYITSSIIIQLLSTVIPKLEEWRDQGAVGQKKLTQTTRYLTIGLALLQSSGLVYVFHTGASGLLGNQSNIDLIPNFTIYKAAFIVLTLTAGTAMVMWLGENITQRGVGNGMSILIFANVVAGVPAGYGAVLAQGGRLKFSIMVALTLVLLVIVVFMEQGQRRIPVTFAKRVVGRRMYGGSSTYIPLKVNQSGVIPIIFASSLLYIPVLLANIVPSTAFRTFVNNHITPTSLVYVLVYGVLIFLFTFFYVYVAFDPHQQADIIRKQGGYIPGIRPGPPTERYLARILNRITVPGGFYLAVVAVVPSALLALWHVTGYPFYGTTLLIAVGVSLETMRQIDSQLMMRNYEGFLK
ncbi:MAG TPA: preprotein translocase subunit SecY [Acidimicrobiaceae bacterium]|nr:preprotein translocase subunit SecY [Acidimicrobiaceae bacterium]